MAKKNLSRHYPWSHRKNALIYPWSVSSHTFNDFAFGDYYLQPSDLTATPVRLGGTMFNYVGDMLTGTMNATERSLPKNFTYATFYARYPYKTANLPAGVTLLAADLAQLNFVYQYYFQTVAPADPNTRQERRVARHDYYIRIGIGVILWVTNGVNTHALSMGWEYGPAVPSLGDFVQDCPIPTLTRCGDCDEAIHTKSSSSPTLTSSIITGFGSNTARDYLVTVESTLQTEVPLLSVACTYHAAAVLAGVKSTVTNSTGTNSLEDWVPLLF
jgi:hypothetical protein